MRKKELEKSIIKADNFIKILVKENQKLHKKIKELAANTGVNKCNKKKKE